MATGLEVAEVFRRHGETYRQLHDEHLGRTERRVMGAITACRTASLGGHTEYCRDCGLVRCAYNSCRNRHCPKCQGLARAAWLADRQAELLPVPYFHVVFTLPAQVAAIAFHNKATVYGILFRAAAKTLRTIAADPRHLGAEIGLVAVLHTWGQNLHHHPHVHCLVPGGGLSPDGMRWIACRRGFFLPVPVLSRLFRRLFLEHLQAAFADLSFFGELAELADHTAFKRCLARLRRIDWVVYAKRPFAGPAQALAYLGRYTHRVAIANSRLVALAGGKVSFRWRDYRHHDKLKLMTLAADAVHPALPAPHPPRWVPSHPPLRLSCQRSSRVEACAVPASLGGADPATARTRRGLSGALSSTHWALARHLPCLRRTNGTARPAASRRVPRNLDPV